jgi:hypothetical protein
VLQLIILSEHSSLSFNSPHHTAESDTAVTPTSAKNMASKMYVALLGLLLTAAVAIQVGTAGNCSRV